MTGLGADLRYALRKLREQPGFSAVAVLALGLGIGATTAIFSVIHAVLLAPLPYPQPDRLMVLWDTQPQMERASISAPDFLDFRDQAKSFESMAALIGDRVALREPGGAHALGGMRVSADFFSVLRPRVAAGRTFDRSDQSCAAVLSYQAWRRWFGAQPAGALVGRTLALDTGPCTVVGVLAPAWQPNNNEIWLNSPRAVPVMAAAGGPDLLTERGSHYLQALGRLRPGVTVEQARQELALISQRLEAAHPSSNRGHRMRLTPMAADITRSVRGSLWTLLAAVGFVLLIAMANVASLELARAVMRQREIVTRVALGATRWRLLRQLLTESVLLALMGAGLGLLVAFWGVDALIALAPSAMPRSDEIGISVPVLSFAIGLGALVGLGFGIIPALHASRTMPAEILHGSRVVAGRGRARRTLVAAEIALALALLSGAGVLARSFALASAVTPGFDDQGVLTFRLTAPAELLSEPARLSAYFDELLRRVRALPGAASAGAILNLPLDNSNRNGDFIIQGRPKPGPNERVITEMQVVTPGYFETMRMPLLAGRRIEERDGAKTLPVVVVNQAFVRRYFPHEDPLGQRISFDDETPSWLEIVGVVGDVHQQSLTFEPLPELYQPLAQQPEPSLSIVLRSAADTSATERALERALASYDAGQPLGRVRPLHELVQRSLAQRRYTMLLWALFAAIALLLVLIGVYGVMSYGVAQRTREIGIRMALGAQPRSVVRLVVGEGLRVALVGCAVGVAGALAVARLLEGLVYRVSPHDPAALAGAVVAVLLAALFACGLPAWRGTRIDPMVALRDE